MYSCQAQRDPHTGIVHLDGEPMVFHCNHYNRFLQLVVEDCHYIQHEPILQDSAAEIAHRQMSALFQEHPDWTTAQRLAAAGERYRYCGFGDLDLAPASGGMPVGVPRVLAAASAGAYAVPGGAVYAGASGNAGATVQDGFASLSPTRTTTVPASQSPSRRRRDPVTIATNTPPR